MGVVPFFSYLCFNPARSALFDLIWSASACPKLYETIIPNLCSILARMTHTFNDNIGLARNSLKHVQIIERPDDRNDSQAAQYARLLLTAGEDGELIF